MDLALDSESMDDWMVDASSGLGFLGPPLANSQVSQSLDGILQSLGWCCQAFDCILELVIWLIPMNSQVNSLVCLGFHL